MEVQPPHHTHNQDHDIINHHIIKSHYSNQMFHCLKIVLLVLVSHLQTKAFAFSRPYVQIVGTTAARNSRRNDVPSEGTRSRSVALASFNVDLTGLSKGALATFSIGVICFTGFMGPAYGDLGASNSANAKIQKGGASTLQSGRTISITRGVNLDRSDFHGQNLRGVAFQQSIVRDANFKGCNLYGASFFDATLDGTDFEGADMTLANIEMAQLDRVNLKNAIAKEMFITGSTILEGIKSIEGSDWTDTQLRKDQQRYLCNHPTAKGTNPTTGVDTRESLMCLD